MHLQFVASLKRRINTDLSSTRSMVHFPRPSVTSIILCYHAISPSWQDNLAVDPDAFDAQIRSVLAAGYRPVSASDAVFGKGKRFHVTFDDAFRGISGAMELLLSLGVPATVFACTDLADDGRQLPPSALAVSRAPTGGEGATMDWELLRALSEQGVEIGSHSCGHPRLPDLSDEELRRELSESRERLQDEIGRPCSFLAYPFGAYDARVCDVARAAGYLAAFAQAVPPRRADAHCVRRISIYRRDSTRALWLKASLPGQYLSAARAAV